MSQNWTTDQTDEALPPEFEQMRQVGALPLGPDWFEARGVPMREADVEPGWPLLHGVVRTASGPLLVIGAPGDDGVGLWAMNGTTPQAAFDALETAMGHGATPLDVYPDEDQANG